MLHSNQTVGRDTSEPNARGDRVSLSTESSSRRNENPPASAVGSVKKNVICVNDPDYGCVAIIVDEKDFDLVTAYVKRFYAETKVAYGTHDHIFNWLMGVGGKLGLEVEFASHVQIINGV